MINWFKMVWYDDYERYGIIAVIINVIVCIFITIMYGINILIPSVNTGICWTIISILSFLMFMGFSGRIE